MGHRHTNGDNMPKLTDANCRTAKPNGKLTKLSDGAGLQLWIHPSGVKSWHVAFRVAGAQKSVTLGRYPSMSLREARDAAAAARRAAEDAPPADAKSFGAIKREWFDQQRRSAVSASTIEKAEWLLSQTGELDDKPIAAIRAPDVLAILRPIEARGNLETASRLRSTISRIFRFAAAQGIVDADPAALLKGAIAAPARVHRAAIIDRDGFAKLMQAIDAYEGRGGNVRACLMLLALTAARPSELRLATWQEFDLDAAVWTVPAGRMKMRLPHRVPLSPQSVAILRSLPRSHAFVFPSERPGRAISESAMGAALRTMGFPSSVHTPHGFRSSFSTLANESGLFAYDAIERSLAHQDISDVRRAYHRADYLEERRRLMNWWADQIDRMLDRGTVPAPRSE